MIVDRLDLEPDDVERLTGWSITAEGACKDGRCVPLDDTRHGRVAPPVAGPRIDLRLLAERLGMPLVHDEAHGLWSLGPEPGGRALASARMPRLALPDLEGRDFDLESLRGTKILLVAWGSY